MLDVEVTDKATDEIVECARHLLEHALPSDDRDDRFSDTWVDEMREPDASFVAAMMRAPDGHPVGLVTGSRSRSAFQLDALVSENQWHAGDEVFSTLLDALSDHVDALFHDASVPRVELWGKPARPWHEKVASSRGFAPLRALHQMRCRLPVHASPIDTRPFRPGIDDESLRLLNNRAFAGHPDQGDLSVQSFADRLGEPWNDPDGIRIHEIDGEMVGFCWTKIHPEQGLGEIYAIGLDPSVHGRGLGVPMTTSGLEWLAAQGLSIGMLYVEADNVPAIRTYERLGFTITRTDRAWTTVQQGATS